MSHAQLAGHVAWPSALRINPVAAPGLKHLIWHPLTRQILRTGKQKLMIFGPVGHVLVIGVVLKQRDHSAAAAVNA